MLPAQFTCVKYWYRRLPIVTLYVLMYLIVSYTLTPQETYKFLPDELTLGDHYSLIFLMADVEMSTLTDDEGARVFRFRRCGKCFLTNNRGFLPLGEYDALLLGRSAQLPNVDKHKQYRLISNEHCIRHKLHMCEEEPRVANLTHSRETYSLCDFCDSLLRKRKFKEYLSN